MTIIGQNFPMTRIARKESLMKIKQGESVGTIKVPGKGPQPVYKIPLRFLSYNPHNTRFLAQSKTLERRFAQELSDENPAHVLEIEKIIWNEKLDRNKNTIDSLIKMGQLQPGVVTADGVILAGNRRYRLLSEIVRDPDKYGGSRTDLSGLDHFEAVILEESELEKKEIVRYESYYQFGVEEKVEYDPIQKYIAAKEQKDLGFTYQEIADNFITITKGKKKEVEKWLSVLEIMNEYLEYIGEEGIYTALKGSEEAFLNLHGELKRFRGRKAASVSWAFEDKDLESLKMVYFDYIRLGFKTHEFRHFSQIFSDGDLWKGFEKNVDSIVSSTNERIESFEEYRIKNPDEDEITISKKRNNDYKADAEKALNKIFGNEKAKISIKKLDEKPLESLKRIKKDLTKLEEDILKNPNNETFETEEFVDAIKELRKIIGRIKQRVD